MLSCPLPREAQVRGRTTLEMHPGPRKSEDALQVEHDVIRRSHARSTVSRRYRFEADGQAVEEELCLQGNVIVLTEGKAGIHRTIKTFTLPEGRNDVLWATYCINDIKCRAVLKIALSEPVKFERIDCISALNVRSKLLYTYTNDGKDFVTYMPFDVQKMWPTDKGVLLERAGQRDSKAPRIFSLFHPLTELAPVNVVSSSQRKLISHDGINICFSSCKSEYVVIYNSRELMHSVCRIRLASSSEMQGNLKTKDLSIPRIQSPAFFSSTPVVSPANQSTPVLSYPLRSRLSDTIKNRSIRSPVLLRVHKATPTIATPMRTPARNSYLSASSNNPDLLGSTLSAPLNRTLMSSSMLSRLNANITVISEPVLSDLSLEIVYTDKMIIPSATEKVRLTEDLLGNKYMIFLLHTAKKLRILKICDDVFVLAGEISAYDFEYLESLKMILVMTTADGHLFLYSGITMLCPVRCGSILPTQTNPPNTRRSSSARSSTSTSNDLLRSPGTVAYILKSAGANVVYIHDVREKKEYSLRFPLPSYCETVTNCINGLEHLLEPDVVMLIKYKWYLQRSWNALQCRSTTDEVQCFLKLILQLIGFDFDEGSPSKHKRLKPESGDDDDWEFLLNFSNCKLGTTPGLKFHTNVLSALCYHILFTLHIVYEELKMNTVLENHCRVLAEFLCRLSSALALKSYREHYIKDFPDVKSIKSFKLPEKGLRDIHVPDFFEMEPPCFMTYVLEALAGNSGGKVFPCLAGVTTNIQSAIQVFGTLIEGGEMAYKHLLSIRTWKSRPDNLEEILASPDVAKMNTRLAYRFIFSCLIQKLTLRCTHDFSAELYSLLGRRDLGKQVKMHKSLKSNWLIPLPADSTKGGEGFENLFHSMLSLRFGEDFRIKEVCSMLTTSVPVNVTVQQGADMSDHEFAEEQEKHLYNLSVRTLALPIGRGMLTLYTIHPIISEPIVIAHFDLTGRAPPKNIVIEVKNIEMPANMNNWPFFHNGVAAGLRVARSSKNVTSSWIALNEAYQEMNSEGNNNGGMLEFGGFMLGLGLGGHLASLNPVFICEILRKKNAIMSAGVLLGLGASKKGTMCQEATNLIAIHIDALLPSTSTELDVSSECRVAAISALGLLYLGSGHYHMCDILLSEIGRPPGPEMEHSVDRESHSLSAGIALGMVMLCKGAETSQVIQTKVRNTLYNYMVGGPTQNDGSKCHRSPSYQIREGDYINISVTSPGATMALGLIYHATENQNIASLMNVPETQYLLDTVQPDYLLLRTLCKGLIMWSTVTPSKDWVESHLTKFISENAFKRPSDETLMDTVDYEGATQAYCNTLAGACFAVGLKFAGSADATAFKTLKHYTMMFYDIQKQPAAEQAGKDTIETSLLVCLLSWSLVMAGSGDLEILRLCRVLRKRIGQGTNCVFYGSHMMIHMAIGFLFLGGGSLTLSTKPEAIAVLICALYPKFPTHFSDNRYHLQALRHLYVLAVEPRLFVCQDVVSSKLVKANIKVNLKNSETIDLIAPCNLPSVDQINSLIVDDSRYWKIEFSEKNMNILEEVLRNRSLIYVKQKAGMMSYVDDPKGYRTALAQCHIKEALRGRSVQSKLEHLESFSNTPMVAKFVENMLLPSGARDRLQERLCTVVMECAAGEQLELLSILTDLISLPIESSCTYNLQQFKMISEFMSYAAIHQMSICGDDVIREIIKDVEAKIRPGVEFQIWYGRKPEQVAKGLPAMFLQLRGSDMSLTSIVKLYNTLNDDE